MTEKILVSLTSIAGPSSTLNQLKYWAKLAGIKPVTHNRQAHVSAQEAGTLREVVRLVGEGKAPSVAVQEICPRATPAAIVQNRQDDHRLDSLEHAVLAIAAQVGKLVEENRSLRLALLAPPADPPRKFIPWHPEKTKDPVEGLTWYHRILVEIFEPWKMRRCAL